MRLERESQKSFENVWPLEDHTCFQRRKETKILNLLKIDALNPSEIMSNMVPHSAHAKYM